MIKRTLAVIGLTIALSACGGNNNTAVPAASNSTVEEVEQAPAAPDEGAADVETIADTPAETPAQISEAVVSEHAASLEETAAEEMTAASEAVAEEVIVNTKLNLNEATGDDYLAAIPGFGNRMVREFLEYRPYVSIRQFRREIGKYVDDEQVAEYEKYVYVPVDVDESDAETLQQLPGVDETIAAELMASRPYGSNEAFLTRLTDYVSDNQLAVAESYLVPK